MDQLNRALLKLLELGKNKQNSMIKRLDDAARDFGFINLTKWRNVSNDTKNSLVHELVERNLHEVIYHAITVLKLDINVRRGSDGLTPLQIATNAGDHQMCDLLKQLGASKVQSEDASSFLSDEDREKSMNIVWLDLEMTSIVEPEILECAVIITDKNFQILDKGSWVIHFDKSVLRRLGHWHQETFADITQGGNGLFADVLQSKLKKEEVEDELLRMIKRHCPEKMCPLAGSSIHIDKSVLKLQMPKVHDYLHYRIIDVSSFQAVMRRWAPWIEIKIKRNLARHGQDVVNHRAMDDIVWSISFMKEFRLFLIKPQEVNNRKNESAVARRRKHSMSPTRTSVDDPPPRNQALPRNQPPVKNQPYARNQPPAKNQPPARNQALARNLSVELYGDEKRLLERLKLEKNADVNSLNLNTTEKRIYDENPHLHEVFLNRLSLATFVNPFNHEMRILTKAPEQISSSSINMQRQSTTEHWGQRKLLLTEIEFLTTYGAGRQFLVIYAGAAPGSHLNFLSSLFPNLEFVLFDTAQFDVQPTDRITIRKQKFDTNVARNCASSTLDILFICNVHTFNSYQYQEQDTVEDMENQKVWHKLLKPHMSLLNFRLPRKSGKFEYLNGQPIIEPWASKRAIECRLLVEREAKPKQYDSTTFEDALTYFHNITRIVYYEHNIQYDEAEGLDHCYDCRTEIFILQQYLSIIQNVTDEADLTKRTVQMSSDISRRIVNKTREQSLGIKRTLDYIQKNTTASSNL
ncbi:unnamed protein product [Rotaria magnacalcarata]|uniref:Cap-specific mRNA (nucleoside-2'-O-)-methyltransferase n=1 Tax=Rotaria magnacalcarata TaxID=392030 RepID=A0A816EB74_9BILA|nr:unnamed protein product [Rotaria magnacalcarata]